MSSRLLAQDGVLENEAPTRFILNAVDNCTEIISIHNALKEDSGKIEKYTYNLCVFRRTHIGNNLICISGSLLHLLRPKNQIVHKTPTKSNLDT